MPSGFPPEMFGFEAENPSNSLYLSLLAGNWDSLTLWGTASIRGCNFLTQNVSLIALGHSLHARRRARERPGHSGGRDDRH